MQGVNAGPLEERPIRELIAQLSRDGSLLVQQEVQLAKLELKEKATKVQAGATSLALGGLVLYAGILTLTAAVILLLSLAIAAWLAALLVGTAVATIGGVMLLRGQRALQEIDPKPERTLRSVQRDVEIIKEAAQ